MDIYWSISWGAVAKIGILIAFACVANAVVKCMHDRCCSACKK